MSTASTHPVARSHRALALSAGMAAAAALAWLPGAGPAGAARSGPAAPSSTVASSTVSDVACLRDLVAPRVTGLRLSTSAVDVTDRAATVMISVDVTDLAPAGVAVAGLRSVWADLYHGAFPDADTISFPRLRPAAPGLWTGSFVVPAGTRPGTWHLTSLTAKDRAHNYVMYSSRDREWVPFTMPVDWQTTVKITDSRPDMVRPTLTKVSFGPRTLDTRHLPGLVHFRVVTADDRGATSAGVVLQRNLGTDYERNLYATSTHQAGGIFTGTIAVPRWAGEGVKTWTASVWIEDATHYREISSDLLARRGWPSTVQVRSRAKPHPALVKVTVGAPVPTADGGAQVPVRAVVDGDGAPVRRVHASVWHTNAPHGHGADLTLAKGSRRHGTWRGPITLLPCGSPGNFKAQVWIDSTAGSYTDVYGKAILRRGAPDSIAIPWLPGDDRAPRAHEVRIDGSHLAVAFSEGVRDVLPALSLYDRNAGAPIPTSSVSCTALDGTAVPCSGGDAQVRRVDFVLAQPMTDQTWPVFFLNLDVALPQITDAAGNPVTELEDY